MWICANWSIDWTAVAAVTALAFGVGEILRRWTDRRLRVRWFAQWTAPLVSMLEGRLRQLQEDLGQPGTSRASVVNRSMASHEPFRSSALAFMENISLDDIERLEIEVGHLPPFARADLAVLRSDVVHLKTMFKLLIESVHAPDDTFYVEAMETLRENVKHSIIDAEQAKLDLYALARETWISRLVTKRNRAAARKRASEKSPNGSAQHRK